MTSENEGQGEALAHLRQALAAGQHWYLALLEAVGLWTAPQETVSGRTYCYLIEGEAFDFLLLAERLCREIDGFIPAAEKEALLLYGKPPLPLTPGQFREKIGPAKYQAYLNYLYGVVVEEAVLEAVEEEVAKERLALGGRRGGGNEAYRRLYGADLPSLQRHFCERKGYLPDAPFSLSQVNEFTYWLFKGRLTNSEKARAASDTKKGLERLRHLGRPLLFTRGRGWRG